MGGQYEIRMDGRENRGFWVPAWQVPRTHGNLTFCPTSIPGLLCCCVTSGQTLSVSGHPSARKAQNPAHSHPASQC